MNENINPVLWGSTIWKTIFFTVSTYPNNPTSLDVTAIQYFFTSLKSLLPCESCRQSYSSFILQPDTNINNPTVFASKNNLITFVYNLRNKVNNKIGLEYGITVKYFKLKLENMICIDGNNNEYLACSMIECPIIPHHLEEKILKFIYKHKKLIKNYSESYTSQLITSLKQYLNSPTFNLKHHSFKSFVERNKACREIINKLYNECSNSNKSVEETFKNNLELHVNLFYLGSTIIPTNILQNLIK